MEISLMDDGCPGLPVDGGLRPLVNRTSKPVSFITAAGWVTIPPTSPQARVVWSAQGHLRCPERVEGVPLTDDGTHAHLVGRDVALYLAMEGVDAGWVFTSSRLIWGDDNRPRGSEGVIRIVPDLP